MSEPKTLPGFVAAVDAIRRSRTPLVVYWRHTLKGNAKNRVLALPSFHARPSCGLVVGIYDKRIFGTDKATEQAGMNMLRADLKMTIENYFGS